jgi:hypothetical protein
LEVIDGQVFNKSHNGALHIFFELYHRRRIVITHGIDWVAQIKSKQRKY